MMADDLDYADLSCYGRKDYQTPNLDALASQGVRFLNAYAAAPVCTPTRVAFMTGRYPARLALGLKEPLEWSAADSLVGLSPDEPSIAQYNWKYMQDEKGVEYLFDLNADSSEQTNLSKKEPAVFETLKQKYAQWEATMLVPIPLNKAASANR